MEKVLKENSLTTGKRKMFDAGREGFIGRFELLLAWVYINDKKFAEKYDPRFHLFNFMKEFTDAAFYYREVVGVEPSIEMLVKRIEKIYKGNIPVLDEIHELAKKLELLHPDDNAIKVFKEEYPYWEKYIYLLRVREVLRNIEDFDGRAIDKYVEFIKEEGYYV